MDGVTVKIDGLKELDKALADLGAELGAKTLRSAMMTAVEPVKQAMKQAAPESGRTFQATAADKSKFTHVSGYYKKKIRKRSRLNKRGAVNSRWGRGDTVRVQVGVFRVPYAGHLEFGTSKMKAQPVIRPAFLATADQVPSRLKSQLASKIEKVRSKHGK